MVYLLAEILERDGLVGAYQMGDLFHVFLVVGLMLLACAYLAKHLARVNPRPRS